MTRQPVPPIELHGSGSRLDDRRVTVSDQALTQLRAAAPTWVDERETAEASRDWWPLSLHWALAGSVGQRAAVVCRPDTVDALAAVAAVCRAHQLPLTVAGGRSGVSGASVPRFGGVLVDLCGIAGVTAVDTESGLITALAGTFGPHLERAANDHGLTVGHFPQSFEISTVGGWVACRGAGQFSTRYGKIEDIVAGLDVLLADGRTIRTGGSPAGAAGPDLTQLFTGSEGTLGIITSVTLRAHPLAPSRQATAFRVATFDDGIELCRRTLRAG
ncbi:MAG TPA: FAD-binding oxidoreductase, partial [Ilumatobacteraceae bacterium]|nr:FAD-binding oxidoreductase [Ilumatobacteraceae bacterium]